MSWDIMIFLLAAGCLIITINTYGSLSDYGKGVVMWSIFTGIGIHWLYLKILKMVNKK